MLIDRTRSTRRSNPFRRIANLALAGELGALSLGATCGCDSETPTPDHRRCGGASGCFGVHGPGAGTHPPEVHP
jgi:hypothetical protein